MSALSAMSLSGMNAARTALNASAHNLANLPTAGFRREQAVMASAVGGGVTASLTRVPEPGNAVATDIVGQLIAKNQFLANLAVFKTNDQMLGSLLDLAG